jgi:hypothetical protein
MDEKCETQLLVGSGHIPWIIDHLLIRRKELVQIFHATGIFVEELRFARDGLTGLIMRKVLQR